MSPRLSLAACCLALFFMAFAPSLRAADQEPMLLAVDPQPLVAETGGGSKSFTIEIADSPDERSRGLMFRADMPADRGMLFVFEAERPVAFWMKNTPMPLDLVFIDNAGTVRSVLPGEPFSEAVISPGMPVRFVLELKAGTAAGNGIRVGDQVRHPAVAAASGG
jgi:uncharacterized membrane protein (UPF0127 family)